MRIDKIFIIGVLCIVALSVGLNLYDADTADAQDPHYQKINRISGSELANPLIIAGNIEQTGSNSVNGDLIIAGNIRMKPKSTQTIAAGTTIADSTSFVLVAGDGGAVTVTSDPTISSGFNGQEITLMGTSDANTVQIQDEDNNAGSTLELAGGVNFTLGKGDTISLKWNAADVKWYELGRSDN